MNRETDTILSRLITARQTLAKREGLEDWEQDSKDVLGEYITSGVIQDAIWCINDLENLLIHIGRLSYEEIYDSERGNAVLLAIHESVGERAHIEVKTNE